NLSDSSVAEYITYPKDDRNRYEPGLSLGGPIVRDKMWFWGAYQPAITRITRTVNTTSSANPSALTIAQTEKLQVQYASGNVTSQISDKLHARVAFNNSWNRDEGLLPALIGADPAGVNYGKTSTFPNWTLSGNAEYVASQT